MFAEPEDVRLTFIARRVGEPEQDVLLTDDELDELEALIERSRGRDEIPPEQPDA